eukprot:TRINITY_DN15158_c0_g1_i3.p1 TRINITY_DN15158_c0_g1~~TRINITY_DN15158_c0_g1_i3.p1  ORF type:complete len:624 (-),score=102.72 TRINITY_DN15158_c0_g1_i3:45-1826(-)
MENVDPEHPLNWIVPTPVGSPVGSPRGGTSFFSAGSFGADGSAAGASFGAVGPAAGAPTLVGCEAAMMDDVEYLGPELDFTGLQPRGFERQHKNSRKRQNQQQKRQWRQQQQQNQHQRQHQKQQQQEQQERPHPPHLRAQETWPFTAPARRLNFGSFGSASTTSSESPHMPVVVPALMPPGPLACTLAMNNTMAVIPNVVRPAPITNAVPGLVGNCNQVVVPNIVSLPTKMPGMTAPDVGVVIPNVIGPGPGQVSPATSDVGVVMSNGIVPAQIPATVPEFAPGVCSPIEVVMSNGIVPAQIPATVPEFAPGVCSPIEVVIPNVMGRAQIPATVPELAPNVVESPNEVVIPNAMGRAQIPATVPELAPNVVESPNEVVVGGGAPAIGPIPCGMMGFNQNQVMMLGLNVGVNREDEMPIGQLHRFHQESRQSGPLSYDYRIFTKYNYRGRLTVVTEDEVHTGGTVRYLVQFSSGLLSSADGVGFVFSPKLPCSKNIQKITSIFVNRVGRICMRANSELLKLDMFVKQLEIGDWIGMTMDLDRRNVRFTVWPVDGGIPSRAFCDFSSVFTGTSKEMCGHLACVVKNVGVSLTLGS